jgi:hypothetical protein
MAIINNRKGSAEMSKQKVPENLDTSDSEECLLDSVTEKTVQHYATTETLLNNDYDKKELSLFANSFNLSHEMV